LNQHIFRVRFDEGKIDKEFFRRAINAKLVELIGNAHGGVGLAHVTKGTFERTEVHLPPLSQQRRIVEKLDALTARLASARAELERVASLAIRLRQSTLKAAFTGELTASWRAGSREPAWPLLPLKDILSEGPSNGWSPKSGPDAAGSLTLKLTATTSGNFRLDNAATKRIYDTPPLSSKYWLKAGDLLIQRANSIEYVGASAIYDGPDFTYIYPDLMMRVRIDDPILRRLAWYFLNSADTRRYFQGRATGTAGNMPKISGPTLKELPIPVPSGSEQEQLLARIDAAFARADRLEAEAARARALLDRLEAAILAKAFRGELVPQDPADEPAAVLLDRIRAQRATAPAAKRGRRPAMTSA
jgi:type I restriction enzyme S subunit